MNGLKESVGGLERKSKQWVRYMLCRLPAQVQPQHPHWWSPDHCHSEQFLSAEPEVSLGCGLWVWPQRTNKKSPIGWEGELKREQNRIPEKGGSNLIIVISLLPLIFVIPLLSFNRGNIDARDVCDFLSVTVGLSAEELGLELETRVPGPWQ